MRWFGRNGCVGVCSALLLSLCGATLQAKTYYVGPGGNDAQSDADVSRTNPLASVQVAVDRAMPGDRVMLLPGEYLQDVITVRSGEAARPIRILGPKSAVLRGAGNTCVIQVRHSHIQIMGFTIDGLHDPDHADLLESYRKKLLYVYAGEGDNDPNAGPADGPTGLKVVKMTLTNARDECVRLRYFVSDGEISASSISHCGLEDFHFSGSGANGEVIYIGTDSDQWNKNPTDEPDQTSHIIVRGNSIDTQGSECIDTKEGSRNILIEKNSCTGSKEINVGAINIEGNENEVRRNNIFENAGAGVRLGGDPAAAYGIHNNVYGNVIVNNKDVGIKFMASPQGDLVCRNRITGNKEITGGSYGGDFNPTGRC